MTTALWSSRGDLVVYVGQALTEPLDGIAPVCVMARVATFAVDTDVTAKLVDMRPNGFA